MADSPTPRTDAHCAELLRKDRAKFGSGARVYMPYVDADFARQLERELVTAQAQLAQAQSALVETQKASEWRPTHRHYKGGLYRKLFHAELETDGADLVVYETELGKRWARPRGEFDTKFSALASDRGGEDGV